MFIAVGRLQILGEAETLFCPSLRHDWVMSPIGVLFWQKYVGTFYRFVVNKKDSSLEVNLVLIKARDPS